MTKLSDFMFFSSIRCDVLFYCDDTDRSVSLNGKFYSPVIDSMRDDFETRGVVCRTLASPYSKLIGEKSHGNPISVRFLRIFYIISKRIFGFMGESFIEKFNPFYIILRRTQAKLIIGIDIPEDFFLHCRKKDKMCIEVLHGFAQSYGSQKWEKNSPENQPDSILLFESFQKFKLRSLEKLGIKTRVIPHPYLRRFHGGNSDRLPQEWELQPIEDKSIEKEILVSLCWGYDYEGELLPELEGILPNGIFYDEIWKIVEETKHIFWRFRFHPVQVRDERYKHQIRFLDELVKNNSNMEWIESTYYPYPSVARLCSGNITMNSSSCYDAASMGLKSLMLCPTILEGGSYESLFSDLEADGYVVKDQASYETILEWANNVKRIKPRSSNYHSDTDWDDAMKRMLSESGIGSN